MAKPPYLHLPSTPQSQFTSPSIASPIKITRRCNRLTLLLLIMTLVFIVLKAPTFSSSPKLKPLFDAASKRLHETEPKAEEPYNPTDILQKEQEEKKRINEQENRQEQNTQQKNTNNVDGKEEKVKESSKASLYSQFAIAVKTGKETALERVPEQMLTFLRDVPNVIYVGETPNVVIGDTKVYDVCTNLYDKFEEKPDGWEATIKSLKKNLQSTHHEGVVEESLGWKLDAHKNIPGFVLLHEKFPDARWYIMIDDDTFLFLQNLERVLDHYSPDEDHYFGSETMFMGCDGVQKFGDGPSFAHGGSGIVISRAAMKKLVKTSDNCIKKYKDCWAGDVRTSLCLRDSGIRLKGLKHFNKDPPNAQFWYPADPCERPITFHHLQVVHSQKLHQTSKLALKNNLNNEYDQKQDVAIGSVLFQSVEEYAPTYGDVFQVFKEDFGYLEKEYDVNRPGADYRADPAESADACMEICRNETKCFAWSYDEGKCWLKNAIPVASNKQGAISGTFGNKYICKKNRK